MKSVQKGGAREARREKILAAAAEVFLEKGFSAATTDMIQQAAGVSKATMYAFFPGKESLFKEVIQRKCSDMLENFDFIRPKESTFKEALARLGRLYLDGVISPEACALYRVTADEAARFPELGRLFYSCGPLIAKNKVKAYLIEAQEDGALDLSAIGADAAASIFLSMVRGEAHNECLLQPLLRPSEKQLELWVEYAVTTFMRAFGR